MSKRNAVPLDSDEDDSLFLTQESKNEEKGDNLDQAVFDIDLEGFLDTTNDSGNTLMQSSDGIEVGGGVEAVSADGSNKYEPEVENLSSEDEFDVEGFFDGAPENISTQISMGEASGAASDPVMEKVQNGVAGPSRIAGATARLRNVGKGGAVKAVRTFKAPLAEDELRELTTIQYAESSNKKSNWALNMFKEWREAHMETVIPPLDCIALSDLSQPKFLDKGLLCDSLCKFITEVRKCNSHEYPPSTIRDLILSIQRHLKKNKIMWKLLSETDPIFCDLYFVVDNIMKQRINMGLGLVKSSDPISVTLEEAMWRDGILGEENPVQLCETLLYVLGLNFALRGGKEHKALRRPGFNPQLTIGVDSEGVRCLKYQEDPKSKTQQGGLKYQYKPPRAVCAYEHAERAKCPVYLYSKYISLLPPPNKSKTLYMHARRRPLPNLWYDDRCWGINTVSSVVKRLLDLAGVTEGNFSNHSLRSTCLTRMHQGNVQEQVVKEFSGHLSDAVRRYKKTNDVMRKSISAIIQGQSPAPSTDVGKACEKVGEPSVSEIVEKKSDVVVKVPENVNVEGLKGLSGSASDVEDFEPPKIRIRTPLKRKSEQACVESNEKGKIGSLVDSMCGGKKFKRVKISLEFTDSD